MKQQVSPIMFIVAIACAVVVLGYALWSAAVAKPTYHGLSAGHPGQGPMTNPHAGMSPEEARRMGVGSIPGSAPTAGR